ncbi:MAG TPA: hypothetical protein EYG21_06010 [Nitrospinaceae bacterium]|nr:hypothetical protein [Nitrospinaceae bacterium]
MRKFITSSVSSILILDRQSIDLEPIWTVKKKRSILTNLPVVGSFSKTSIAAPLKMPFGYHLIQMIFINDASA